VASSESTAIGGRFPVRLAVTVTDSHSNPVRGAVVTFSAPTHGPSGTFGRGQTARTRTVRVRTNAAGIAVAPVFVANRSPGGFIVTATAESARSTAFALVNEPRDQTP
jgi:hypothetical protein